jgi:hypothetical protein
MPRLIHAIAAAAIAAGLAAVVPAASAVTSAHDTWTNQPASHALADTWTSQPGAVSWG